MQVAAESDGARGQSQAVDADECPESIDPAQKDPLKSDREGTIAVFNMDVMKDGIYATASPNLIGFRQSRRSLQLVTGKAHVWPTETVWKITSANETAQLLGPMSREVTIKWFDASAMKSTEELFEFIRKVVNARILKIQPLYCAFVYLLRIQMDSTIVWFTRDGQFGEDPIRAINALARGIIERERSSAIQSIFRIINEMELTARETAMQSGWVPGGEWHSPCE